MIKETQKSSQEDPRDDSSGNPSPHKISSEIDGSKVRGRNKETPGILRVDSTARSSRHNIPVPFLTPQVQVPSSPQPSVDRVSVTFAIADEPGINDNQEIVFRDQKSQLQFIIAPISSLAHNREAEMRRVGAIAAIADGEDPAGEEDDYSASASAIIQRRASLRRPSRKKRRSSSPFQDGETGMRRRSSAFTTSSGETAISVDEGGTQEQIFENLKLHKEVLSGVRQQPWPLRRKIKLVQQAKSYVRRHEGALQERLAQNRSTRDIIARASILINKNWQYFRRELVNLQTWLVPWELRIKEIESHFGSAVASYFIFLRWLFWINLVIAAIMAAFVTVPEMLTASLKLAGERKNMLPEEKAKSTHLLTLWEFEGALKYSPFFYGWYTNQDSESGYRLPLAYFLVNLIVYVYSFVAILRKMAKNSRMSKLSEKEDECAFTWKLFTGWDFMIGNPETADNRTASIVLGFKEALLEEAEKQKVARNWKTTIIRTLVNIAVAGLLALSAYAVVQVVARSEEYESRPREGSNWWRQNEITIVMSLISYIFPIFFEILGYFENYHPRKQLRFQLARIMLLNLLNLYSLIIALFGKIDKMTLELERLKPNTTEDSSVPSNCRMQPVPCRNLSSVPFATALPVAFVLLANITSKNTTLGISMNEINAPANQVLKNDDATFQILNSINRRYTKTSTTSTTTDVYDHYYDDEYEDEDVIDAPESGENYDLSMSDDPTYGSTINTEIYNASDTSTAYIYSSSGIDEEFIENNYTTIANTASNGFEITKNDFETTTDFTTDDRGTMTESSTRHETGDDFTSETTEESITVGNLPIPETQENVMVYCYNQCCENTQPITKEKKRQVYQNLTLKLETRRRLRRLCWETMFGQELAKLTVMDVVLTTFSTLSMDFCRAVFIRHMNNCWCWDLEKQFPQYGDFKIAENILHLVNNQGMVWMGMFFSPGLPTLNVIKIGFLMYLRSWAVMTSNVPHEIVFRASRSNNFYFALLLTMHFLCVLPVGYAIIWVEPSWHCGPFSGYSRMYRIATESLKNALPSSFDRILDYIASPGIVIPLIVLMALIIYYMVSLTGSLREANNDLKIQLRQERTEERRKMFKIAEKRQDISDAPFVRWKKILPSLPANRTAMVVIEKGTAANITLQQKKELRKQSATSEAGEATDGEQDSLPHDPALVTPKEIAVEIVPKNNKRLIGQLKHRSYSSGSMKEPDTSQGSQCSEYGIIPKIRISGTEGVKETHNHASPGKNSVHSIGHDFPTVPEIATSSESKQQPE